MLVPNRASPALCQRSRATPAASPSTTSTSTTSANRSDSARRSVVIEPTCPAPITATAGSRSGEPRGAVRAQGTQHRCAPPVQRIDGGRPGRAAGGGESCCGTSWFARHGGRLRAVVARRRRRRSAERRPGRSAPRDRWPVPCASGVTRSPGPTRTSTSSTVARVRPRGPPMIVHDRSAVHDVPSICSSADTAASRAVCTSLSLPERNTRPNRPTARTSTMVMLAAFSASLAASVT